jgi:glyoxylase-like metal-dependent hydrolase (beta-lactamase superfamily II)
MPEEIIPGLYRLPIPLPNNSLGSVNVYAAVSADGLRLIDSGWNAPEVYTALVDELRELGMQVSDIKEILLTHNHPDHIGLAERFAREAGALLLLHRLDAASEAAYAEDRQGMLAEMQIWLQTNGMPREERETLIGGMHRMAFRRPAYRSDTLLEGGEVLAWHPFRFEVIWTPGHAAGLVCLYEPQAQVLISSDHVLERISPNIGLYARQSGDPLEEYLRSLQLVRDVPVKLVLPGHGAPGCVAKTLRGTQWPGGSPFLLYLSSYSKEASDEGHLPTAVFFVYPSDLSLANHVHDLVSLQRSPCCLEGKEAHAWLDLPFDEPMILLDQVVQFLTCLSSTDSERIPAALSSAIALG